MTQRLQETQSYFISSMRIRRELIPVAGQDSVRCVTSAADNHVEADTVLPDQVSFDNELIKLGLKKPNNVGQKLLAKMWPTELDRLAGRPKPGEPLETLLHYVS